MYSLELSLKFSDLRNEKSGQLETDNKGIVGHVLKKSEQNMND